MTLSREQLHKLIDQLPLEKLPGLADLLDKLIDEDCELLTDGEIAKYRRIRQEMKNGEFVHFNEMFCYINDV